MSLAGLLGITLAAVVAALIAAYYTLWLVRTRRARGRAGLAQRSRLTCPKCGGSFVLEWVPGISLSALRLGSGRYMSCPRCHRWSTFDLRGSILPPAPRDGGKPAASPPTSP